MTPDHQPDEADLVSLVQDARAASQRLIDTIDSASVADCMTLTDEAGWNARDHLVHVVAWKRGVVYRLRGGSVAEGMGVEPRQLALPWDSLNEVIRSNGQQQPVEQAVKGAIDCQRLLEESLEPAPLELIGQPAREVVPDLTGLDPDEPFMGTVRYCVVDHLDAHRGYIQEILSAS